MALLGVHPGLLLEPLQDLHPRLPKRQHGLAHVPIELLRPHFGFGGVQEVKYALAELYEGGHTGKGGVAEDFHEGPGIVLGFSFQGVGEIFGEVGLGLKVQLLFDCLVVGVGGELLDFGVEEIDFLELLGGEHADVLVVLAGSKLIPGHFDLEDVDLLGDDVVEFAGLGAHLLEDEVEGVGAGGLGHLLGQRQSQELHRVHDVVQVHRVALRVTQQNLIEVYCCLRSPQQAFTFIFLLDDLLDVPYVLDDQALPVARIQQVDLPLADRNVAVVGPVVFQRNLRIVVLVFPELAIDVGDAVQNLHLLLEEDGVVVEFEPGNPPLRVHRQALLDEIFGQGREVHHRKVHTGLLDFLKQIQVVGAFEGVLPTQHLIKNNPDGPNVGLEAVGLARQHFRGHREACAQHRLGELLLVHFLGEPQVCDFANAVVEEDVGQLQISVHDLHFVKGPEPIEDLLEEHDRVVLRQELLVVEVFLEVLVVAVLGHNEDGAWGLEHVEALNDIVALAGLQDGDFGLHQLHELLIGVQIRLGDGFDGHLLVGLLIDGQVYARGDPPAELVAEEVVLHLLAGKFLMFHFIVHV